MPSAAALGRRLGLLERWAEASNPVIVYCVSSRPNGMTQQPVRDAVVPPPA